MGRSFVSYYVKTKGKEKREVIGLLESLYTKNGYDICLDLDKSDIVLYLFYPQDEQWVVVQEKDILSVPVQSIKSETNRLSRHFKSTVIAGMVYNSDVLIMGLCDALTGQRDVVVFDQEQSYMRELCYNPKNSTGNASKWAAVCGCDVNDLKEVWKREYIFADEKLVDIERVLGLGKEIDHSMHMEGSENHLSSFGELIKIGFRSNRKFSQPYEIIREGNSSIGSHISIPQITSGKKYFITYANQGGPCVGLSFYLESPLFQGNDIYFSEVFAERKKDTKKSISPDNKIVHRSSFQKIQTEDGRFLARAFFPDFPIPEGIKVNRYETMKEVDKIESLRFSHSIGIRFSLEWNGYLEGKMKAFIVPVDNSFDDNSVFYSITLGN